MSEYRIKKHPILKISEKQTINFQWEEKILQALEGEVISSALFANGIRVFGHHHKDGAPMGIFCANGQCAQCMVVADGIPVKACMTAVGPGMIVKPMNGLAVLPDKNCYTQPQPINEVKVPVLILGGGPAGLSAAIELGKLGIEAILVDDKQRLGGKLVLQTHRFFGSINAVYAGTRGIDIATKLETETRKYPSIKIWTQSTALAVYSDKKVGILKNGTTYVLVIPEVLLVATGAREKSLTFQGNTIPGVYGAGAFQTLLNRDLVKPSEKLFIVGGGNVGLIAGYHALQAGIQVVGLVEALPECGGYRVHKDKLTRMGVPIYNAHTILSANGTDGVESVTIAQIDPLFRSIPGTEKSFACDTVLVAVGLDPVNEFFVKARDFGLTVLNAGDAEEIAEASAAIFSGKIKGMEIASLLGFTTGSIPKSWYQTAEVLKSKPGKANQEEIPDVNDGVMPIIHCSQEIPCDPCSSICPQGLIYIDKSDIRAVPKFLGNSYCCGVCEKCVTICPGLAITLVDYQGNPDQPIVSIPYEFHFGLLKEGDTITVTDTTGNALGELEIHEIGAIDGNDRTGIVRVYAPAEYARQIAGIRVQEIQVLQPMNYYVQHIEDDTIVCRCERVTAGEIRELIRRGYTDLNEIKTVTRAMMGSCGSKTCSSLIHRLFMDEGIDPSKVMEQTRRPIFMEVPLGVFAGQRIQEDEE